MKQFDVLYVNEDFELMKYNCLCKDIVQLVQDLPDEISKKSIICIKDTTWDELI